MSPTRLPLALLMAIGCQPDGAEDTKPAKNEAPTVAWTAPVAGAAQDATVPLTVRAQVEDDGPIADLVLALDSNLDGALPAPAAAPDGTIALTLDGLTAGSHTLTLSATDAQGEQVQADTTVDLLGPLPVPAIGIQPSAPVTTDDLAAVIENEPALSDLTLSWSWTVDGAASSVTTATVPAGDTSRGEVWQAVLTGTDALGRTTRASTSTSIGNLAPSLATAEVTPTSPVRADDLVCGWTGFTDPDGDPEQVAVQWWLDDGISTVPLTGSQSTRSAADLLPGDVVGCIATPLDGILSGPSVDAMPVTVANQVPTVATVDAAGPSPTVQTDALTCLVTGVSDPDGDPVLPVFRWYRDGALASTTPYVADNLEPLVRGETWTCSVTVEDDWDTGVELFSTNAIVVGNAPPQIGEVRLAGGAPCSPWVCSAHQIDDLEGDSVAFAFRWWVDGVEQVETSDTLDSTPAGSEVQCGITPDDGWNGAGGSVGAEVLSPAVPAVDAPPEVALVSIQDHGRPGDVLACAVDGADDCSALDIDYVWTLDDQPIPGATGEQLDLLGYSAGDTIRCLATVGDGQNPATTHPSNAVQLAATGWDILGEIADGLAGYSVAVTGDLDGDGYREIGVGAPNASTDTVSRGGRAYIVTGRDDVESLPLDAVSAGTAGTVLVGASGSYDVGVMGCGPWWSVGGCPDITDVGPLDGRSTGPDGAGLGFGMAYPGDIDNDGIGDLLVSAPYMLAGQMYRGRTYVLSGGAVDVAALESAENGFAGYVFDGECGRRTGLDDNVGLDISISGTNGDLAGYRVTGLGDFDGDGLGDFAVGVPNSGWGDEGSVYVVYGRTDGAAVTADQILQRGCGQDLDATLGPLDGVAGIAAYGADSPFPDLFHQYGQAIGPAGDFDGDGYDDLLVQATPLGFTHTAVVVRGGPDRSSLQIEGADPANKIRVWLGNFSVIPPDVWVGRYGMGAPAGGGGDVNGDGRDDLVFQLTDFSTGDFLHVLLGRTGDDGDLDLDEENPANSGLGWTVHGPGLTISNAGEGEATILGDVNGDGYDDIGVGLPIGDPGERGAFAVIYGGPSAPTGLSWSDLLAGVGGFALEGTVDGEQLGWSVAGGDIDGDGLTDVLAGAPGATGAMGELRAGRVRVEYGRNSTGAIDQYGGPGTDDLWGSPAAESLVGGRGDDLIDGAGGADVLYGGAGADLIAIGDDSFRRVDGGEGEDTLALDAAVTTLDLTAIGSRIRGIERIALDGQALTVSALQVGGLSDTSNRVVVEGTSGQLTALAGDSWRDTGLVVDATGSYFTLAAGSVELWISVDLETAIPPTIDVPPIEIDEAVPVDTLVVAAIATDPDGDDAGMTYQVVSDPSGAFGLTATGDLVVTDSAPLDFEGGQAPFTVRVRVTDQAGLAAEADLSVDLRDVNEPPRILTPAPSWSVEEGQPVTIGRVSAMDPDAGDLLTWSITDDPSGIFDIDPVTGDVVLLAGEVLNFETVNAYIFTATATDIAGLSGDAVVDLSVLDADVIEQFARLNFQVRGKSVWEDSDASVFQPLHVTGLDPAVIPAMCLNPEGQQSTYVDNWSSVIPLDWLTGDGQTLPIEMPFSLTFTNAGEFCAYFDVFVDSGGWDANIPVDLQIDVPDNVAAGTTVPVSSSYTVDWAESAMWGNSPAFRFEARGEAVDFELGVEACEYITGTGACEAETVGPMTITKTDVVEMETVAWSAEQGGEGLVLPAPIYAETTDFRYDWTGTLYTMTATAGFNSHIGTLDLPISVVGVDGFSADARINYELLRNWMLLTAENQWEHTLTDTQLLGVITLENGDEHAFTVGTPTDLVVPLDADVDGDGLVATEVRFDLDLDFGHEWTNVTRVGFVLEAGDFTGQLVNDSGEVVSERRVGPFYEQDCGAVFGANGIGFSEAQCVNISGVEDHSYLTTSPGDFELLGAIQLQ